MWSRHLKLANTSISSHKQPTTKTAGIYKFDDVCLLAILAAAVGKLDINTLSHTDGAVFAEWQTINSV
jgi:hypothetical protein